MRNLKEFPLTREEILSVIDTAIQRVDDDDRIGSIDAYVLRCIYEQQVDNKYIEEDFRVR